LTRPKKRRMEIRKNADEQNRSKKRGWTWTTSLPGAGGTKTKRWKIAMQKKEKSNWAKKWIA